MLVEREIGHQPFQPTVLFFELLETAQITHPQVVVLLLPWIEGLLGDSELATEVADRGAGLGLPEGIDDLLFGEFRLLH